MRVASRLLIAGSTLSQFGNWVNLTAVMVVLAQDYGAALVSAYFLARTVAPYVLSRSLVVLVRPRYSGFAWAAAQGCLAAIMLVLAFVGDHIVWLLCLLALAGILQTAASAWIMQVVDSVSDTDRRAVVTAISTGTSVAVVAGPAVGGLLTSAGGLFLVFLFNAGTYLISIIFVPWRGVELASLSIGAPASMREVLRSIVESLLPIHPAAGRKLRSLARFWILFGLFGGVFTAVETPVFTDLKNFDADEIGLAISAYGLGGLLVFIASTFFGFGIARLTPAVLVLVGVLVWALFDGWLVYLGFFIAGLGFSLVSSAARVLFSEEFSAAPIPVGQSWAWVNQLSLLTSVVSYMATFVYFSVSSSVVPTLVGVVVLSIGVAVSGVFRDFRPGAVRS